MDTAIWVAIVSVAGVAITAVASVIVAAITNRKETKGSAESALEKSYRLQLESRDERIKLRDEQIEGLERNLRNCREKRRYLENRVEVLERALRRPNDAG